MLTPFAVVAHRLADHRTASIVLAGAVVLMMAYAVMRKP